LVGIAWQGSRTYREDRFRSVPLKHFAPLARLPGVRLVSLQKGPGAEQLAAAGRDWGVLDLGPRLDEAGGAFLDTAAVMACLDLVVTSDTSIPHLAGALAVPVWVALPDAPDWRWLLERPDSPWYPTMRLFRQRPGGGWDEVFARIAEELRRQRPVAPPRPAAERPRPGEAGELRRQGTALCRDGRFSAAVGCLRQALLLEPHFAPGHNNLGVALAQLGQWAEAAAAYREALRLRPEYAAAQGNLGEALLNLGRRDEAIACCRRALQLRPGLVETHNNLGVALAGQGQYGEACTHYREAVRLDPGFALAHRNLATALEKQGQGEEAEKHYREAIELEFRLQAVGERRPPEGGTPALAARGQERARAGKLLEAVACFRAALQRRPDDADAQRGLARALVRLGRQEEAAAAYRAALRLRPEDAEAQHELGDVLRRLGRPAEAEAAYRQALRRRPGVAATHNHLGIALIEQGRPADAERCFRAALRCEPEHAQAHNNLGVALEQQGKEEAAVASYRQSLRLQPGGADAHKNLALIGLLCGNFEEGWPRYEWRWKCPGRAGRRNFAQPRWDGTPLAGRTILLWAEQGLGDALQFVRYAALVRRRGGVVLVEAPPQLLPLLKSCPGIDRLLPAGGPLPDFDVQAPFLSLPGLLRTTLETIPAPVPYLSPEPQRLRRWGEELRAIPGFKIGIAWQGSPTYGGDRHRSIPLKHFEPLARLPGVRLVSLQKKAGREQLAAVAGDWGVLDLAPRLDEDGGAFLDTAAVLPHLDLLVCSDSAVVHLAGALGVAAWVALPVARDWRWLRERSDCPWYPSLRLFRQRRWGDWDEVFRRIAAEVSQRQKAAQHRPLPVEVTAGELLARIAALEVRRRQAASGAEAAQVSVALGRLIAARARGLHRTPELAGDLHRSDGKCVP
jgi:Flp pilus assembly protein TadD